MKPNNASGAKRQPEKLDGRKILIRLLERRGPFHRENGFLCRRYFDVELQEVITEFKLETSADYEAYLEYRKAIDAARRADKQ